MAIEYVRSWHATQARVVESRLKRLIDLVVASSLIAALAPLLVLVAVLLALEAPGRQVLFRQRRGGLYGREFKILKFRTMTAAEDGDSVQQAKPNDPRISQLGLLLRRSSIDELPQLINVLNGEMSLVGPRPHALAHDKVFSELVPGYENRQLARPGMTGLAQVSGYRGQVIQAWHIQQRVAKDVEYIQSWSVMLDLRILLRTAFGIPLRGNPAKSPAQQHS